MIFENNKTIDGNNFLQNFKYEYLYDKKWSNNIHFIYMSNFFLNELKDSYH